METGLGEAVASHLHVADAASESYAFRHALLQEALYSDLLPSECARLHASFAQLLVEEASGEVGASAAELAYHYLASHDLAGALVASVRAAAQAKAVHAPGRGCVIWSRRCRCGSGSPRRLVSPVLTASILS